MEIAHGVAAVLPRWKWLDKVMHADRIQSVHNGTIFLESGHRVEATDELMASGPARTGDFYTRDGDTEKLVSGAEFQTSAVPVPHALDIPSVSADVQPGFRPDEPTSGAPDDPDAIPSKDAPPLEQGQAPLAAKG